MKKKNITQSIIKGRNVLLRLILAQIRRALRGCQIEVEVEVEVGIIAEIMLIILAQKGNKLIYSTFNLMNN